MSLKELRELEKSLENQRQLIKSDKSASASLLQELNIFHLCVPKESQKASKKVVAR